MRGPCLSMDRNPASAVTVNSRGDSRRHERHGRRRQRFGRDDQPGCRFRRDGHPEHRKCDLQLDGGFQCRSEWHNSRKRLRRAQRDRHRCPRGLDRTECHAGSGLLLPSATLLPSSLSPSAISGTFASLPEGAVFSAGGQAFQISYKNDAVTLTSVGAVTTTSVTSSLNPSVYGQSVTFTATVTNTSGSGGVPTGSVTFYDGSSLPRGRDDLSGSGTTATSTFAISTMTAGIHSISAVYTATGSFFGSTSST